MSANHRVAHHPDESLLLDYAGGAGGEALALIVATHLAFCADCRAAVTAMEAVGGVLLADLPPEPLAPSALHAVQAKLDTAVPFQRAPREPSRDRTPEPLRSYLGGDLREVRWRHMGPKLSYRPLFRAGPVSAKLLRGIPGTDVGAHTHRGLEYTVVLTGGFTDGTGNYGPGDMQVTDASVRHNPIADPGEDCINLAVTTAPLRFESLLQRIAAPFFGF